MSSSSTYEQACAQVISMENVSLELRHDIREELKSDAAASIVTWLTTISDHFQIDRDELFKLLEIDAYDLNVHSDHLFSLKEGIESYRKRNKVKDPKPPKQTTQLKQTKTKTSKAKAPKTQSNENQENQENQENEEPTPVPAPTPASTKKRKIEKTAHSNENVENMEVDAIDELAESMNSVQVNCPCEYERAGKGCKETATIEIKEGLHKGAWVCAKHTSWVRKKCGVQGCNKIITYKEQYCKGCASSL